MLQYCHFVRISAVAGSWRNLRTTSCNVPLGFIQALSWPGMPVRWESASSRVAWEVVHSSWRTKSSRRRETSGVFHARGLLVLAVSSMRREIAAAVNDLVVEAV